MGSSLMLHSFSWVHVDYWGAKRRTKSWGFKAQEGEDEDEDTACSLMIIRYVFCEMLFFVNFEDFSISRTILYMVR